MFGSFFRSSLITLLLACSGVANAEVWQAVSGRYQSTIQSSYVIDYVFGGAFFEDGFYSPEERSAVLVPNVPGTRVTVGFHSHTFQPSKPPSIDLSQMRADFSGLFWYGWRDNGEIAIGGNLGAPGWVDLVDNQNGTYSATWVISPDDQFNGPGIFSITFAAAVPEASTFAYLLGGIASLTLIGRRRSKAERS